MKILRDLSELDEYVPGRGVEEVAREHGLDPDELAKLASNENPLGPPPAVEEAVREAAPTVNVYPTALHEDVRGEVAEAVGAPVENVVLGAGADGVFDTVGRAVLEDGDGVLTPSPGFSYYGMSARNLGGYESSYGLRTDDGGFGYDAGRIVDAYDGEKIVYITAPNNPTGTDTTVETVERVADEVDGLVFVDEAYHEFSDRESAVPLALERDDVAVARTFSKAYGLAGLRVGYGVLPDGMASAYRKVVTPFCVGGVSLRAASAALGDDGHVTETVELARWGREYMTENLDAPTYDTAANFVLVDVSPCDASEVAGELERRGVIVRDTTSFGLPECIRVSVGTREETRRAVREINDVYADARGESG
ncbi:histidinol-phosphate transaminase [Haladaptatus sp. F3-133]|jgi:histidinol-phosphate aminotransferase|uniref:Histidinol-phosphate aminotransferase n=1 Tax=Halorutilus salinus TaxID=2487751 RepID=A0A9Q4C7K5_9EURY|nr:histidinol-phosphate transaminase [Halorutilus salinus]MCX2819736.1 histidinol-phosphate transaminase [Halorutilus salinus]